MQFRFSNSIILLATLLLSCRHGDKDNGVSTEPEKEKSSVLNDSPDANLLTPYSVDSLDKNIIRIGLLVSTRPKGNDASRLAWDGAQLAVDQANATGGYKGKKFKLFVRSCDGPWGMGSKQAVNLAFQDSVSAIIASADGRNSHLIEQVTAKTHVPVLSVLATEPTLTEAFVPWFFRSVPNDRQLAEVLVKAVYAGNDNCKVGVVAFNDYDSNSGANEFIKEAIRSHREQPDSLNFNAIKNTLMDFTSDIIKLNPEALVFFGHPGESGKIIKQIYRTNPGIRFFGNSWLMPVDSLGLETSSKIKIGLVSSHITNSGQGKKFINDFKNNYGINPDIVTASAYDGTNILIRAIKQAGTDHDQLRVAIEAIDFRDGVTGDIRFDKHGNLIGQPYFDEYTAGIR